MSGTTSHRPCGNCAVCGRPSYLRKDGTVGYHYDTRDGFQWPQVPCPGWTQPPVGGTPAQAQARIEEAIRTFPFDDFGLSEIDPRSEFAEWVPFLAKRITAALKEMP